MTTTQIITGKTRSLKGTITNRGVIVVDSTGAVEQRLDCETWQVCVAAYREAGYVVETLWDFSENE